MSIGTDKDKTDAEEEADRKAWAGDYDGTDCPNCGRARMLKCVNGKRRCEKCNWDPEKGDYSDYEGQG